MSMVVLAAQVVVVIISRAQEAVAHLAKDPQGAMAAANTSILVAAAAALLGPEAMVEIRSEAMAALAKALLFLPLLMQVVGVEVVAAEEEDLEDPVVAPMEALGIKEDPVLQPTQEEVVVGAVIIQAAMAVLAVLALLFCVMQTPIQRQYQPREVLHMQCLAAIELTHSLDPGALVSNGTLCTRG